VGQPAVGDANTGAFALSAGFWPDRAAILAFAFTPATGVALATVVTSNIITVTGLVSAAPISIATGSYAINGGPYTTAPGTVNNGDTVTVRQTSSSSYSTATVATLTIAGVSSGFSATTQSPGPSVLTITGPGGGSGTASATLVPAAGQPATCGFSPGSQFIPLVGAPRSPPAGSAPAGVIFPHGLFDFTVVGCAAGGSVTITVSYPQLLPTGVQYWKYGPTAANPAPHWYVIPATFNANTATFTLSDGGLGDDDLAANGTIVDQGGPGVPPAPAPGAIQQVPTLSEWGVVLMTLLMGLFGVLGMRRR
jgi:hypothetical protein